MLPARPRSSRRRRGRWLRRGRLAPSRSRSRRHPSCSLTLPGRLRTGGVWASVSAGTVETVATNMRLVPYTQDQVFAVLSDPERYAGWVVGAKKTRTIDPEWPQPGSRFAHQQGAGPLHIDDITVVRELEAPNRIVLEAKIRPLLTARVTLTLDPLSRGTLITMDEVPIGGPVSRLGRLLEGPLHGRNSRALRRLEGQLAEVEMDKLT